MSAVMKLAGANAWIWRTIIFKGFNGWFIVVAMALFSQDISWTSMSTFQRLRWIIMGLVAGGKFIEGFIDQGVGKLKAEISNSAASDTSLWQRAVSAVPEARQFQSPSLPLGGTQQFARQPELPPTPPATTVTAAVTVKSQQ